MTTQEMNRRKIASDFFENNLNLVANLASRWADEKDYENPEDYKDRMQKAAPVETGIRITKMIRRPFGFEWTLQGVTYRTTCKMNGLIGYKRIK